jgi:hypothetical protein
LTLQEGDRLLIVGHETGLGVLLFALLRADGDAVGALEQEPAGEPVAAP